MNNKKIIAAVCAITMLAGCSGIVSSAEEIIEGAQNVAEEVTETETETNTEEATEEEAEEETAEEEATEETGKHHFGRPDFNFGEMPEIPELPEDIEIPEMPEVPEFDWEQKKAEMKEKWEQKKAEWEEKMAENVGEWAFCDCTALSSADINTDDLDSLIRYLVSFIPSLPE